MKNDPRVTLGCITALAISCADDGAGNTSATSAADTGSPMTTSGGADETTSSLPASSGAADTSSGGMSSGSSEGGDGSTGAPEGGLKIFLNYEGVEIAPGPNDSTANTSSVLDGTFEPFRAGLSTTQEIRATVTSHFDAFDIEVVDTRPAAGPYIMVVVSPSNPLEGGATATGPLDCGNTVDNDIVFAFTDDDPSALDLAIRASGRIGTSLGVSNSISNTDLSSNAILFPGMAAWTDDCIPVDMPPDLCSEQALAHCDSADEHNPFQIILEALGPAA